jgi:hypothetical protein
MAIQKKLSTIFLSTLIAVFIIQSITAVSLFFLPTPVQAANNSIQLEVPIPTLHGGSATFNFTGDTGPIADYIKAIYTFAVGAVGIVAAVVLMIGGVTWITAGGNASSVGEAKSMIGAALTGMVLVLTSYLILGQVNPALINLQSDVIKSPEVTQTTSSQDAATNAKVNCSINNKCQQDTIDDCQLIGGVPCIGECTSGKCVGGEKILCSGSQNGECVDQSKPYCVRTGGAAKTPTFSCSDKNYNQYCDGYFDCDPGYYCSNSTCLKQEASDCIAKNQECEVSGGKACCAGLSCTPGFISSSCQ